MTARDSSVGGSVELPFSTFNIGGPPGTPITDGSRNDVGGLPIALGTAAFMYLSARLSGTDQQRFVS